MRWRLPLIGAAGIGAAAVGTPLGYRWLRGWGSTPEERAAELPGDELCPDAEVVHTRAVTAIARPEAVWAWLPQIGQDRSGFYSYTLLENLVGCRMPRVHEIRPEWQQRSPGDRMWMATPERYGGGAYNVVHAVTPGESLVTVAPKDPERLAAGLPATWVWQFVVRPGPAVGATRLVVRSRYLTRQLWLEPMHFVMERRMLRTIRRLAERR